MQDPAPVMWINEPVTLQLPVAAKVTTRLEDAVALTAKSGSPKFLMDRAANVIVWLALATENDCGTSNAGLKLALPACEAVMVHNPAPLMWINELVTPQFPLAAKVTARLEVAVAPTAKSGSPKFLLPNAANVIVWLPLAIENGCGTSVAGLKSASPA